MRSRAALKEADLLEDNGFRAFLEAAAAWVGHVLTHRISCHLDGSQDPPCVYDYLSRAEDVFSCQVCACATCAAVCVAQPDVVCTACLA